MESRTHHSLVTMLYEYISDFSEVEQSLIESDIYEVGGSVTRMAEVSYRIYIIIIIN